MRIITCTCIWKTFGSFEPNNFNFNEGEKSKYVDTTVLLIRRYNTPSRENVEEKNTHATTV